MIRCKSCGTYTDYTDTSPGRCARCSRPCLPVTAETCWSDDLLDLDGVWCLIRGFLRGDSMSSVEIARGIRQPARLVWDALSGRIGVESELVSDGGVLKWRLIKEGQAAKKS